MARLCYQAECSSLSVNRSGHLLLCSLINTRFTESYRLFILTREAGFVLVFVHPAARWVDPSRTLAEEAVSAPLCVHRALFQGLTLGGLPLPASGTVAKTKHELLHCAPSKEALLISSNGQTFCATKGQIASICLTSFISACLVCARSSSRERSHLLNQRDAIDRSSHWYEENKGQVGAGQYGFHDSRCDFYNNLPGVCIFMPCCVCMWSWLNLVDSTQNKYM